MAKWKYETDALQIFFEAGDLYTPARSIWKPCSRFYSFDAWIVEKSTNLSIPFVDLYFQEVAHGTQLLSFVVSEPGDLMLTVFDPKTSESISNTPYDFTVFIGMRKGSRCSSLVCSDVPQIASGFSILAKDGDIPHCICNVEIRNQFRCYVLCFTFYRTKSVSAVGFVFCYHREVVKQYASVSGFPSF